MGRALYLQMRNKSRGSNFCKKEGKRNIREAIIQCNGKSNKRPGLQNNSTTSKPLEEEVEEEEEEAKELDPHPTPSSSSAKGEAHGYGE
ncbi:hypothetical protein TRV_06175 [Trichophyton verrucosum HKI 0517]|uniref:Uncharacterized protein n=1 Tax=Trichophyton verrucosum (strain HKI 0517) TaxID=663202 RepID=D4DG73_TRIVH|nr:uncharacterized protein TRV_06175 [Trichophyton verrucosum HKI 0517]EFE39128.1 hypothetical protein TRV_06175 [Trichophyton verrucosum HKI 0517]